MLKVICWGSRGSIPVSGARYDRHGGATTCLEFLLDGADDATPSRVIIDCGTGLADLARSHGPGLREALFLQTHVHWDHIQGFPFFTPIFDPGAAFEFLAVDREGLGLREVLGGQMAPPTFPVKLDDVPAKLKFDSLPKQGQRSIGGLTLRWAEMCHPSGSTAFRLNYGGASIVFSGDVEVQMGSRDQLVELGRGADLLIMDAQYFPDEYDCRRGYGHSTPIDAVELAVEAGVERLLMTHHDPGHDDERLDAKVQVAKEHAESIRATDLTIGNAAAGMEVELPTAVSPSGRDKSDAVTLAETS